MKSKHIAAILSCLVLAFSLTQAQSPISIDLEDLTMPWTETHNLTIGDHTMTITALNNWYTPGTFTGAPQLHTGNNNGLNLFASITLPDNRGERAHIEFTSTQPGIQQFRLDSIGVYSFNGSTRFDDDLLEIWDENEQTLLGTVSLANTNGGTVTNTFTNPLTVNVGQKITVVHRDVSGNNLTDKGWRYLTVTALVPEPSTYAFLLGLGALGFAACRRRRRH